MVHAFSKGSSQVTEVTVRVMVFFGYGFRVSSLASRLLALVAARVSHSRCLSQCLSLGVSLAVPLAVTLSISAWLLLAKVTLSACLCMFA